MNAFPKYPTYKESGVEWLGDVPEHWDVDPLRACAELSTERNRSDLPVLSVYREYGVIPKDSRDDNHNATSLDTSNYKVIRPGDLAVNKMKAWQGSLGVSQHHGIVSPAYITCRIDQDKVNGRYLHYLLRSRPLIGALDAISYGVRVGQWDMRWEDFKLVQLTYPPRAEQDRIVAFLDEKTAQIDALIAKKQRQIELLDEQKAILINRAVTRGLHPNPDLQDSGIEGVGQVPAHWRIVQNRRLFTEKSRKITNSDEMPLSLSQVDGVIPSDEMKERSLSPSHRDNFKLCLPGDLILNRFKAHLGVFFESPFRGAITYHYGVFEPHEGIQTKYFEFLFHTEAYRTIYAGVSNGMSIGLQNLSNNNFYQVLSVVPPEEEQVAIMKHAEQVVSGALSTIERINSQIQTLQTLRSTLIAHAVTGKIKV